MNVSSLIHKIGRDPLCILHPPTGKPSIPATASLPPDLSEFYERCGGASLFLNRGSGFTIVPPADLTPANPVLLGSYYLKRKEEIDQDISAWWYLIAKGRNPTESIVIDLHPERLGRCYDAFHQVYATADSKVVAHSFTALLEGLLQVRGENLYWEQDDFEDLGCAYD